MSIDKWFFNHLLVVVRSAKYYTTRPIHLLLCVRDQETKVFFATLLNAERAPTFSFEIITFKADKLLNIFNWKVFDHPIECYFRILFPSMIPASIKKIIYLDADMIVCEDISKLYDLQLNTIMGWVVDRFWHNYCKKYILEDLNIKLNLYINAGLLLIDLEKWRNQSNESEILSFLKKNFYKLKMLDQDLINIYFQSEITLIHEKWNHFLFHGEYNEKIRNEKSIYHLIGSRKWNSLIYPNYTIKKIYNFFAWKSTNILEDLRDIFVFVFFSLPLSKFLIQKSLLHYKWEKFKKSRVLFLLFVFYPPVFFVFLGEIFSQLRKKWLKGLFLRFLEFFN